MSISINQAYMAKIKGISFASPSKEISNEYLSERFSKWTPEKIYSKTGIRKRYIASQEETAADLAITAAENLFSEEGIDRGCVDMLIFVSQTPNQIIPTTACEIHCQLRLETSCGAFDVNQGCSGYIYGLMIASSIIDSGAASNVLLLTGDTYSKLIHETDASLLTLFGDGASATLISRDTESFSPSIGPFLFGTDGSKASSMHCYTGGFKSRDNQDRNLRMDGADIISFALEKIPTAVNTYLKMHTKTFEDYDYVLLHQASKLILDRLHEKMAITDKGVTDLEDTGNTVSSSLPCVLAKRFNSKKFRNKKILLVGFGVGLSWGVCSINYL